MRLFLPIKQPAPIITLSASVTPVSITALAPIATLSPRTTSSAITALGAISVAGAGVVSSNCATKAKPT